MREPLNSPTKNLVIIGLAVALIIVLLLKGCPLISTPNNLNNVKPVQPWTLIATHTDSIPPPDTVYVFRDVPRTVIDSFPVPYKDQRELDSLKNLCMQLRVYKDSVSDENVTIYMQDTILGVQKAKSLSYKLKVPLIINTTKFFVAEPSFAIIAGLRVGATKTGSNLNLAPLIGISAKRQSVSYSYELFNQVHSLEYTRNIFTKIPKPPKEISN